MNPNTLIFLRDLPSLRASDLVSALQGVDPLLGSKHDIDVEDTALPMLFSMDGVQIAIMSFPMPAPGFADHKPDEPNAFWPSVEADLKRHRAHLFVSTSGAPADRASAIRISSILTVVSAALLACASGIGVYWAAADALVRADHFGETARKLGSANVLPTTAWVKLGIARSALGTRVYTKGLAPFAGRELELSGSGLPLGAALAHLGSIADYLLQRDIAFRDGETVGPEGRDRFRIDLAERGPLTKVPAYLLKKI